jgi:hypothetical protein
MSPGGGGRPNPTEGAPPRRPSGSLPSPRPIDVQRLAQLQGAAVSRLRSTLGRLVFRFEELREAHRAMEANEAHGKMQAVHD